MAGRERGGLAAAESSLLDTGPFVVCPGTDAAAASDLVSWLDDKVVSPITLA